MLNGGVLIQFLYPAYLTDSLTQMWCHDVGFSLGSIDKSEQNILGLWSLYPVIPRIVSFLFCL